MGGVGGRRLACEFIMVIPAECRSNVDMLISRQLLDTYSTFPLVDGLPTSRPCWFACLPACLLACFNIFQHRLSCKHCSSGQVIDILLIPPVAAYESRPLMLTRVYAAGRRSYESPC